LVQDEPRDRALGSEFGLETAYGPVQVVGVGAPQAHEVVVVACGVHGLDDRWAPTEACLERLSVGSGRQINVDEGLERVADGSFVDGGSISSNDASLLKSPQALARGARAELHNSSQLLE